MSEKPSMKLYIADTFEELLAEKSFEEISVNDLAKKCGISRTTFYHHFKDKFDLVTWIYECEAEKIKAKNQKASSWKNLVLDFALLATKKKKFYKLCLNCYEQNSLLDTIWECGYIYCRDIVLQALHTDILPKDLDFSARMYSLATAYMQRDWILNGMKIPPDEFAEYLCENIPLPLQPYFND